MAATEADAAAAVEAYLTTLEGDTRRVAEREWGLTVDAAGWPLHVGVAMRDGLMRAQAEVIEPERVDDHVLLHWNRSLPLVRFSHTSAGPASPRGSASSGPRVSGKRKAISAAASSGKIASVAIAGPTPSGPASAPAAPRPAPEPTTAPASTSVFAAARIRVGNSSGV